MAIDGVGVDEPFYFSSSGSNDEGKIEIILNDMVVSDRYNGAKIIMRCNNAVGTPIDLIKMDAISASSGFVQFCNDMLSLASSTVTNIAATYGDFNIKNLYNGSKLILIANNSSGVPKTLIECDPNTETANMRAYSTVIKTISSDSDAVDVKGVGIIEVDTTGGDVTIGGLANGTVGQPIRIFKKGLANNMILEHQEPTGTQKFVNNAGLDLTFPNYGGTAYIYNGASWYEINY